MELKFRDILERHRGKNATISLGPDDEGSLDVYYAECPASKLNLDVEIKEKGNEIEVFWRKDAILPDAIISFR